MQVNDNNCTYALAFTVHMLLMFGLFNHCLSGCFKGGKQKQK